MVNWSATALVNGIRYLVASLLFGVLGFITSNGDLPIPERLLAGFGAALSFGSLYALNLLLVVLLKSKYDEYYRKFIALLAAGIQIGGRLFGRSSGNLASLLINWTVGLFLLALSLTFMFGLLLMRVAASASDPVLYFLKRAKIIKWLPDDYPLFSWSLYLLVGGRGRVPEKLAAGEEQASVSAEREAVQELEAPAALAGIKSIAAGNSYTLALTESGEVYAWGLNDSGRLGLGDTENRLTPTKVPGLTKVKAIAAGGGHALALTESGEVYAWGLNYGELGLGDTEDRLTPTKVPGLSVVKAIAAGLSHSLALTETGEVYAWGINNYGQLGLGDSQDRLTPTKIPGLARVKAIAAGWDYSLALTESGEVYTWGSNNLGRLGLADTQDRLTPTRVPGLTTIKAIAAGAYHSLALAESGDVYSWGLKGDEYGGLLKSDGLEYIKVLLKAVRHRTPTKVPGLIRVRAIAAGEGYSLALTESGEVYAWGWNEHGQLGLGDTAVRLTPTKVPGLSAVKAIAAGFSHSLALTESGEVYAWGSNEHGQLGLGDTEDRLIPTKVGPSKPTG
jgi:alpha-tubulin suppressor-like RCC1 family protein